MMLMFVLCGNDVANDGGVCPSCGEWIARVALHFVVAL